MRRISPVIRPRVRATAGTVIFAGMHRGFSPPGVADIVTAQGGTVDLDAELSWNYELGVRSQPLDGVSLEATVFRLDFENQIVPASVAGGSGSLQIAGRPALSLPVRLREGLILVGPVPLGAVPPLY